MFTSFTFHGILAEFLHQVYHEVAESSNRLHTCKSEGLLFLHFLLLLELSEPEGLDDTQDPLADLSSFILSSMFFSLALNSEKFE